MGETSGPSPAWLVFLAALLFVAAILLARLLLAGGWAWGVAAVAVPVAAVVLAAAAGWRASLALTAFFVAAILGLRAILLTQRASWSLLLLLVVFLASAALAARVAVGLWSLRQASATKAGSQGKNEGEEEGKGP